MKSKIIPLLIVLILVISSCAFTGYDDSGTLIVSAKQALKMTDDGYILLDAQKASSYAKEHVAGVGNIERKVITVADPVPNSIAPADLVAQAAGLAGITSDSSLLIYDDNKNMDSSRLYWTLKVYGHKGDIRVVSGGLPALASRGANIVSGTESIALSTYKTSAPDSNLIITTEEIAKLLDNPENTVIIDVRTDEENRAGTIPGSIHINYENNIFRDSTFRPVQQARILYKENGILPDNEIVLFCKTSIRAANSYVALYNAGYRNIRIYDGAWLEWTLKEQPVFIPQVDLPNIIISQDNS